MYRNSAPILFLALFRQLFLCVAVGLWAGLIIGFITEYYTSNAYRYLSGFIYFSLKQFLNVYEIKSCPIFQPGTRCC